MADFKLILSNTKIVLENDESRLSSYKEAIDYILDVFMSNREQRDIKIYLVDKVEDADIFETIIKPLVEYYVDLIQSESYITFSPYFTLYVETNKQTYTAEQFQFLNSNYVYMVQEFTDIPDQSYIPNLGMYYLDSYNKIIINNDNANSIYEVINYLVSVGFYNLLLEIDWNNCDNIDFDNLKSQLDQYRDLIIQGFEQYTVPILALNIDNAFCKLYIAHHDCESESYRTSPISTFAYREGTGSLGDYTIKDGNMYLNKYCLDIDTFKLGTVYDDLNLTTVETIQAEAMYSCDKCSTCYLNQICNNGNPGINYLITQNYNTMPNAYCTWQNMMMTLAKEIIDYFEETQTNDLFKSYFTGATQRGVKVEY